jgi:hypothetical protein
MVERKHIVLEKRRVAIEEIESQSAFQLPKRDMLALVNVIITNVLNNLTVSIPVQNNKVAVQVCAAVQLINTIIAPESLNCTIGQ